MVNVVAERAGAETQTVDVQVVEPPFRPAHKVDDLRRLTTVLDWFVVWEPVPHSPRGNVDVRLCPEEVCSVPSPRMRVRGRVRGRGRAIRKWRAASNFDHGGVGIRVLSTMERAEDDLIKSTAAFELKNANRVAKEGDGAEQRWVLVDQLRDCTVPHSEGLGGEVRVRVRDRDGGWIGLGDSGKVLAAVPHSEAHLLVCSASPVCRVLVEQRLQVVFAPLRVFG